jgi:hypothetical protein
VPEWPAVREHRDRRLVDTRSTPELARCSRAKTTLFAATRDLPVGALAKSAVRRLFAPIKEV